MPYEMLVGLEVTDDAAYTSYRQEMTPLLEEYGGGFHYDFKISEVLKSKVSENINRVFTIFFKDEDSMNAFFDCAVKPSLCKLHSTLQAPLPPPTPPATSPGSRSTHVSNASNTTDIVTTQGQSSLITWHN